MRSFVLPLVALCATSIVLVSCTSSNGNTVSGENAKLVEKQLQENKALMQKVGRLIIIPNEEPIIAKINEADLLVKEQPFYAGIQNGDYLLLFAKAQKAILYSEKRNLIVNSGPFTVSNSQPAATPSAPAPAPAPAKK